MTVRVKTVLCDFCGRSNHEIDYVIAGPSALICTACVDLCNIIIAERKTSGGERNMVAGDIGA